MLCPKCRLENAPEAAFCNACAAKLDVSPTDILEFPQGSHTTEDVLESQSNPGQATGSYGSGIFVGRQPEMVRLTDSLNNALSTQGRLVMLVGEPGIGKTRTAQELAARAETLRAQVL